VCIFFSFASGVTVGGGGERTSKEMYSQHENSEAFALLLPPNFKILLASKFVTFSGNKLLHIK
jgi:hypothetical protein